MHILKEARAPLRDLLGKKYIGIAEFSWLQG